MGISFSGLQEQVKRLRAKIDDRIATVLDHGQFIMGPEVIEFEERLQRFSGAREAITVANGTDALQIVLMASGVGVGDAVFVPSFTFTATAEAIVLLGARPIFVDVDPVSFNIDCDDLERAIEREHNRDSRGKVIIGVDMFGLPANWPRLNEIAQHNDLLLIADAAQSFGGAIGGERVGKLAPVTTTSFFPAKPLGCFGDGGAILTDDTDLASLIRSIRLHGQGTTKYDVARIGVNSRLDTLQAAVLLAKIDCLDEEIACRDRIARQYSNEISYLVKTPIVENGYTSAWAQYTIKTRARAKIQHVLKEAGIPTAIYYPKPMHLQSAYAMHGDRALPVSEALCDEVLSLPLSAYASIEDIDYICSYVRTALHA